MNSCRVGVAHAFQRDVPHAGDSFLRVRGNAQLERLRGLPPQQIEIAVEPGARLLDVGRSLRESERQMPK